MRRLGRGLQSLQVCLFIHSFVFIIVWMCANKIIIYCECDKVKCFPEMLLEYTELDVFTGETVTFLCNTSADSMWTYDTDNGYVDYVYWNRRIDSKKPRLALNDTADDSHSLIIFRVQLHDSGLYDCYDNSGIRTVGYQLTVKGMYC